MGATGETLILNEAGQVMTKTRHEKLIDHLAIPFESEQQEWTGIARNFRGEKVIASWNRVPVADQHIYLVTQMELDERFQPIREAIEEYLVYLGVFLLILTAVVPFLARALSRNVETIENLERVRRASLLDGQEEEKHKLSMELHDDIAPRLAALGWQLQSLDLSEDQKEKFQSQILSTQKRVKELCLDLSNASTKLLGLKEGLESLLLRISELSQIKGVQFS